jgi:GNAT superfamily N-acetyltransferase
MELELERTADHKELAALNRAVQSWHHQQYPNEFKPFDRMQVEGAFEKLVLAPDHFAFMAKHKGEAIGYLLCIVKRRAESAFQYERTVLNIDQVAVVPEHRRAGVAQALLDAALQMAKERNITAIQLDHWAGNEAAERFFAKNGFVYFNHRMGRTV